MSPFFVYICIMNNPIQLKERVDFYLQRSRNKRFSFHQYNIAFREAQIQIFEENKADPQKSREMLYTLKTTISPTITVSSVTSQFTINHINYPSDYRYFGNLNVYVDGVLVDVSPMDLNRVNRLLQNDFTVPTNKYIYQIDDSTGWTFYRGLGGTITASLIYFKQPSDVYIGNESDLIDEGAAVLTFGVSYTAVEESVHGGVTYNPGDVFTASSATLTSGQVIPSSVLTMTNLPTVVYEDLARITSEFLLGTTEQFNKMQFVNNEVNKTL